MYLGIIADDLTGAADTGTQFAKWGFYTILLPFGLESVESVPYLHEAQVVALNTSTRGMQAGPAYDMVRDATELLMRMLHPENIYKKVDSTLRGNVGAEIEAVMDAAGNEVALLAPAFPDYNRTTAGGIHFVNGQPLSQTEVAFDPVNPVNESHIPTLIRSQTGLKVGNIYLEEVRRGSKSLQQSISQHVKDGEKIIVLDAATDDDLSNIAEAGMSMPSSSLMVGSAGLANQLSRLLKRREHADRLSRSGRVTISTILTTSTIQKSEGVIIIISGSLSAVTSRQLDKIREVRRGKIIPVEVHKLIEDQETDSKQESEIISEIISATEENAVDLRHETRDMRQGTQNRDTLKSLKSLNVERGTTSTISGLKSEVSSLRKVVGIQSVKGNHFGEWSVGARHAVPLQIVECLGRIALQVVKDCPQPIRGLIITGGDTALAVFKYLGISHVRLIDEILPGIPYGQVLDGELAGLTVVTKAGAFGDENALVKCIDFLDQ